MECVGQLKPCGFRDMRKETSDEGTRETGLLCGVLWQCDIPLKFNFRHNVRHSFAVDLPLGKTIIFDFE